MAKEIAINKKQTIALIELLEDVEYHIENNIPTYEDITLSKIKEKIYFLKNKVNE